MKVASLLVLLFILPFVSAADVLVSSAPPLTAMVGVPYHYQITASDGTNKTLTYALLSGPSGMSINSTGFISFLPPASGSSNVTLTASNGSQQAVQSYMLAVQENSILSFTLPLLGGPKQKRSNPGAFDEHRKNVYVEESFTLKNTGTQELRNISFSSNTAQKYNVTFSGVPLLLAPNAEATIKIKARVPGELDAFFTDKTERKVVIGDVSASAESNGVSISSRQTAQMEAQNMLIIRDVTVYVNDRVKNVDENDRVENLRIGDDIKLEVDVENLFSSESNEDVDIDEVAVNIDTNTKVFDIDSNIDIGNVRADTIETGSTPFFIEEDASDGTFKITLEAHGTDDNGAAHGERISFSLEVVRKQNEIIIEKISFSPSRLACRDKDVTMAVLLRNVGKSDEEKAAVRVESKELGYAQKRTQVVLRRDETLEEKFLLPLRAGRATIQIEAFVNTDQVTSTDGTVIEVPDCGLLQSPPANVVVPTAEERTSTNETAVQALGQKTGEEDIFELVPAAPQAPRWVVPLLTIAIITALGAVAMLAWVLQRDGR